MFETVREICCCWRYQNAPSRIAPTNANTTHTASTSSLNATSTSHAPGHGSGQNLADRGFQVEAITVLQCRRSRQSRWLGLTARHQGSDRTSKIDASPGIATHHDGFECNTSSRPQQRGKTLRSSGLRAQISATVQILRSGGTQIDASTMTSSAREWRKRRIPGAGRPGLQAQSGQRRTWYPIRRGGSPKNAARFLGCPALPRPLACAAANAGATHASPLTKMRL